MACLTCWLNYIDYPHGRWTSCVMGNTDFCALPGGGKRSA
jgi:hypothetical protein